MPLLSIGSGTFFAYFLENRYTFDLKNYPGNESWFRPELIVLEIFRDRIEGDDWSRLRNRAVESLLLPRARRWAKSRLWIRRNFSARVFRLHAQPEDESLLLSLMVDKKFLIRSPASFALIDLDSKDGVIKILQAIQKEPGYVQFIYRDALLKGSQKVLEILIEAGFKILFGKYVLRLLECSKSRERLALIYLISRKVRFRKRRLSS